MKKSILINFLILFLSAGSFGSVTLLMRQHDAAPGSQVTVPVKVRDFLNIISLQGTIQFDQTITSFVSVQDFGLPGLNSSGFGTTQTGNGKLTFSWFDGSLTGITLPDTAIIFSIKLNVTGTTGQVSTLDFVNVPTTMEIINSSFATEPLVLQNGSVHVQDIFVPADVTLIMDTLSGTQGSQVMISVRAIDFTNINSIQGTIQFDPAIVTYGGIGYYGLPGLASSNFGTSQISGGKLTFSWVDANLSGQDMADNTPLFSMIFNLTGNAGTQSVFSFATSPAPLEVTDSLLQTLTVSTVNGRIRITGSSAVQSLTLSGDSVAGAPYTQVTVPFRADNFIKIISMQGTLDFNTNIVTYAGIEQFGLSGMDASNFGTSQTGSGKLTFSWYDQALTGQTVSDSSVLFAVRFDIIGSIGDHTDINFINSPTPVEVIDSTFNPASITLNHGHVEVFNVLGASATGVSDDSLCTGDSIMISYTKWGDFNAGNIFSIQLSDNAGSFASPVNIGSITSDTNGVIHAFIPAGLLSGTQYKIRVNSSDPVTTGGAFSGNISIFSYTIADAGNDTSACVGENITLTASGGTQYLWDNNSDFQSISVSPTSTTMYSVTVSNGGGCSSIDSVLVTVYQLPVVNIGPDQEICAGQTVSFTASGGVAYQWNTGDTTASISFIPGLSTDIIVTVTDTNTCSSLDTAFINVINVNADAGIDVPVCSGDSITLVAGGGDSYIWSTGSTLATTTVSPVSTQKYYVTVTGTNLCTTVDSVTVFVNPLPVADAGNDTAICLNDTVVLHASGGVAYSWSNAWSSPDNRVTPLVQTTYYVTVTDENFCSSSDNVTVSVNTLPVANAGSDVTICRYDTAILSASGGVSYYWSNGSVQQSTGVFPLYTTFYIVTVTDTNNCHNFDSVSVVVNFITTNAGPDIAMCQGDSTTLTAGGGILYQWNTGETTQDIVVHEAGIFIVTATGANGCSAPDSIAVIVNPIPVAEAGPDIAVCSGDTAHLAAGGGVTYIWSNGTTTGFNNVTVSGSYQVTVYDTTGCSAADSVLVTVNSLPVANAGNDTAICRYDTVTLAATGGISYSWSNGTVQQSTEVSPLYTTFYIVTVTDTNNCSNSDTIVLSVNFLTTNVSSDVSMCEGDSATLSAGVGIYYQWNNFENTPDIIVQNAGLYTVTVTDANGCSASDSIQVTINPLPVAGAGNDVSICAGDTAYLTATGGISYIWNNGASSQVINVTVQGLYIVTVTGNNTCTNTDTVTVQVNPVPVLDFGPDQTVCAGTSVVLDAGIADAYIWNTGAVTQTIQVPSDGLYAVTITTNNCTTSDDILITFSSVTLELGTDTLHTNLPAVLDAGTGFAAYLWSTGDTAQQITVSAYNWYFVTVTDNNGCTAMDSIYVDNLVGVQFLSEASRTVSVFPNPAREKIFIEFINNPRGNVSFTMMDLNGKIILSDSMDKTNLPGIDVSNLRPGMYNLKISDKNCVWYRRIIIQ